MWIELLEKIRVRFQSYGERMQSPATGVELAQLKSRVDAELAGCLPDEYLAFLRLVNGLDWNGLVVYATSRSLLHGYEDRYIEGFVEGNLNLRDFEPMKNYLVFAEDGTCLFAYSQADSEYQAITSVGLTKLDSFQTFGGLLTDALKAHL